MRVEDQIKKNKKDINKLYEEIDILHTKHKISMSQEINDEDDYQSKIQTLQIQIDQLYKENNELEKVQFIFKGLKDPIINII
jgi:hypothetical protein